jgi:hypothetical protein
MDTFSGLDAGKTYKVAVDYHNNFGEGDPKESSFVSLTKKPQPATLTTIVPTDGNITFNWTAPVDFGQSAITGYKIYRDDIQIATLAGNVYQYNSVGLGNGNNYRYTVKAVNAIGDSTISNELSAIGVMTIVSAVATGKTLTLTVNPNGKRVNSCLMFGFDNTPIEGLSKVYFNIPEEQISATITSNITIVKTFSQLSDDLSKYVAVVASTVLLMLFNRFNYILLLNY